MKFALWMAFSTAPSDMLVTMLVPGPLSLKLGSAEQPPGPEKTSA